MGVFQIHPKSVISTEGAPYAVVERPAGYCIGNSAGTGKLQASPLRMT